jgi:molybdopterin-containing oxidoreductase family membrane subunit
MTPSELKDNPKLDPATGEYRVIAPGQTFLSVTEKITRIVLTPDTALGWFAIFSVGGALATVLLVAVTWLFLKGTGIWAVTQPVAWGFAIINFVWWIGIGHAGTLISAILLLFKQGWRNSINRFAEAMTIFAVVCAGLFPLIHIGRPWLGYWLLPYPNTMNVWPQFRSPLLWDVRGFNLRNHLCGLLVHRHGSRLRHHARPRQKPPVAICLWPGFAGLARVGAPLDAL